MNSKKNIRIIIASRPGTWQRFLLNELSSYPSVEVIGVATGSLTTMELSKDHHPDIVLLDSSIPTEEAVAILKSIKVENPSGLTVALSDAKNQQQKLAQAGADQVISTYEFRSKIQEVFNQFTKYSSISAGSTEDVIESTS